MLKAISTITDFLYPRSCLVCGRSDFWLCPACESCLAIQKKLTCVYCGKPSINGLTHPSCAAPKNRLDGLLASGHYSQLESIIHSMKYGLVSSLSEPLGELMIRAVLSNGVEDIVTKSLIVPVPLHPRRLRERGFNQSVLLAQRLGGYFRSEVSPVLRRIRDKKPQATLTREQRLSNQKDVYDMTSGSDVKNKSVLLIDDVATTAATLMECAEVLKKAGANEVWAIVLAHGG